MNLSIAIALVAEKFVNKTDKSGQPYVLHCLHVMNTIKSEDENVKIAAVMHDLIEDTDVTFKDLADMQFSSKVLRLMHLVTHDKTTSYDDYIKAISCDTDATDIKLADLRHNSDITRLKGLRKKDFDRLEKYHKSYTYLSNY